MEPATSSSMPERIRVWVWPPQTSITLQRRVARSRMPRSRPCGQLGVAELVDVAHGASSRRSIRTGGLLARRFELTQFAQVLEGGQGFLLVQDADREPDVDDHVVPDLHLGREREVDLLEHAGEIHLAFDEAQALEACDLDHFGGDSQTHGALPGCSNGKSRPGARRTRSCMEQIKQVSPTGLRQTCDGAWTRRTNDAFSPKCRARAGPGVPDSSPPDPAREWHGPPPSRPGHAPRVPPVACRYSVAAAALPLLQSCAGEGEPPGPRVERSPFARRVAPDRDGRRSRSRSRVRVTRSAPARSSAPTRAARSSGIEGRSAVPLSRAMTASSTPSGQPVLGPAAAPLREFTVDVPRASSSWIRGRLRGGGVNNPAPHPHRLVRVHRPAPSRCAQGTIRDLRARSPLPGALWRAGATHSSTGTRWTLPTRYRLRAVFEEIGGGGPRRHRDPPRGALRLRGWKRRRILPHECRWSAQRPGMLQAYRSAERSSSPAPWRLCFPALAGGAQRGERPRWRPHLRATKAIGETHAPRVPRLVPHGDHPLCRPVLGLVRVPAAVHVHRHLALEGVE